MNYIKSIYISFLWSLTIATLCFRNLWLQMRVNTGLIFGGLLIVLSIILIVLTKKEKVKLNWITTTASLIICTAIGLIVFGFDRMKVVPASLIRAGIHQTSIPFFTVNMVLLLITAGGFVLILVADFMAKKK